MDTPAAVEPAPVTAIVAAYDRAEQTRETIRRLQACVPPPAEILVHFDNGADFDLPSGVRFLRSTVHLGPGGGRNRMIREATCDWVASFDDDSYPEDPGFFREAGAAIHRYPEAGVIACAIRHKDSRHDGASAGEIRRVGSFVGCGCLYRKSAFQATRGYLPLPIAYGMEEIDLALQLHALGIPIIEVPGLKVFHDTDLQHHETARIAAGALMNQALFAWVRYPVSSWPYGFLQWLNKGRDTLRRGRRSGALRGLLETPLHLWRHRHLRAPVSREAMASFRALRRS